jgi:hypothetical protein
MEKYAEASRDIPVFAEVDVLVAGGGTSGVTAAVAAGRAGADTLIVEQFGFLGGTQTAGLVGPVCPNYHPNGRPLTLGIGQEIWERLARRGAAEATRDGCYDPARDWPWFDPEALKYLLDDMVEEAGVRTLFHTVVSDVIVCDGALRGIVVENKSGRQAILAKVTVDATGDADVAYRSGVPCESGRALDGLNQPASLRFHVGNVDWKRCSAFLRSNGMTDVTLPTVSYAAGAGAKDLADFIRKAVADGIVDAETVRYFQFYSIEGRPGEVSFNCPEIRKLQATDGWDLSRMHIEGRKAVRKIVDFCRRCIPGFEKCYIVTTGPMVGIRTSRRIVGEYVLTESDVLSGMKFADAVARNNWPPDIHSPKEGEGLILRQDLFSADFVEVPYRCLVPLKVDGLLVTGRCVSATFEAQAAIRISRTCHALGQAAGTAAVMAACNGRRPRNLDGAAVRRQLETDGLFA